LDQACYASVCRTPPVSVKKVVSCCCRCSNRERSAMPSTTNITAAVTTAIATTAKEVDWVAVVAEALLTTTLAAREADDRRDAMTSTPSAVALVFPDLSAPDSDSMCSVPCCCTEAPATLDGGGDDDNDTAAVFELVGTASDVRTDATIDVLDTSDVLCIESMMTSRRSRRVGAGRPGRLKHLHLESPPVWNVSATG
jgi:hypothetical protein